MVIALGCPLELDGNTVLLKTPQTLVAEYREAKLELAWNKLEASFLLDSLHGVRSCSTGKLGRSQQWSFPAVNLEANSG